MSEDFELFQEEFKKWQIKFGLTGYNARFKYEPIDSGFAGVDIDQTSMVATIGLNSNLDDRDKPFKDIKLSAKHEALHLLVGRLEKNGRFRYASSEEIYEATEELIHRLENLI